MALPGPLGLGRSVVLNAGQAPPEPWSRCRVIVVDEAALREPASVVGSLHAAWGDREPVVIALAVDPGRFRDPQSWPVEPWTLLPDFEAWADRLQFLVWANSYDARADPDHPVWWWGRKACRLGAVALDSHERPGDVLLPDGRAAWIDGGPRSPFSHSELHGAALVHRESIEAGRLQVAPDAFDPGGDPPLDQLVLDQLAPDQLAAVVHRSGPARVIAPAGSGKTRVLTERLRHLVVGRGWERDGVLAVAYNKKAQEELDARCTDFRPRTRTLNSLGYALLADARARPLRVLDERDVRRLVDQLAPARRHRANTDPIGPYLEALGQVRLGLVDPEAVEDGRDDVPGLAELFPRYRAQLAAADAVDFDEQIYGAVEALLADGAFRQRAQAGCRHLLVDEFQDLTPAHVLMLRLLSTPVLDTFGVGDDDQVIYGHAGADPGFLIHYDRLWPAAGDHPLEVNYRCPPAVVSAAAALLSYNERRVAKVIRAAEVRPGDLGAEGRQGPGAFEVRRHRAGGGAESVVETVRAWLDGGTPATGVAVLTRVNAMLLAPHVALAAASVPLASSLRPEVLDRTGLRAALAYVRIATAAERAIDAVDLIEILRRPSRGLPQWFADRLRRRSTWAISDVRALARTLPEKDGAKVERLVDDLRTVRSAAAGSAATTAAILRVICDDVGLAGAMSLLDSSRGGEGSSHLDDLEALAQVAALHPEASSFETWLRDRFQREADPHGVTLSTVHRVKGMEWDRVVVYGVSTGILPHRLAGDVEEERRVLHVAITRGRDRVVVLADRGRPSSFLAELNGSAPHSPAPAGALAPNGADPGRRRPGGGAGRSEPVRAAQVEARPGLSVVAPGGFKGEIRAVVDDGVLITLATGGSLRVRFGETVSIRGRDLVLVAPPEQPAEVAATEDALRAWRTNRSRTDRVAPFIVCSDRTLRAIATSRPASLAALRRIDGIGPTKLELYGDEILAVVTSITAAGQTVD